MAMKQFQSKLKGKTVLVDFSASWCGPCKAMAPVIREIKTKYKNRATIMEIDIDTQKTLATDYMVQSIPTLIIFRDGNEVRRLVGIQSEEALEQNLNSVLENR